MQQSLSTYLSVLKNNQQSIIKHNYLDHSLKQQTVCTLNKELPGIVKLKQKFPQVNVQISKTQIKLLSGGIYIGQLDKNNRPHGYGIIRYSDKSIVEAMFKEGKANGKGFKWFGQNWYYVGDFFDNNFDGRGYYESPQLSYLGDFRNNCFHGQGELKITQNNGVFNGEMKQGQMEKGTLKWEVINLRDRNEILKFEFYGTFVDNQFDGPNCVLKSKVGVYRGGFKKGRKHGQGRFQFVQNYQYIGEYKQNMKNGQGTIYNPELTVQNNNRIVKLSQNQKNISYRGNFLNGMPHGNGEIFDASSNQFVSFVFDQGINQENF